MWKVRHKSAHAVAQFQDLRQLQGNIYSNIANKKYPYYLPQLSLASL